MTLKIAIADDHPMVITGLRQMLLEDDELEVVFSCKNGDELLTGLETQVPDLLLLDIKMPGQSGEELVSVIRKKYPEVKIVVLTNFDSPAYLSSMLRHGVQGYLLKTTEKEVLFHVLKAIQQGEIYIEPSLQKKLDMLSHRKSKIVGAKIELSDREKQVLQLIGKGYKDKEVAATLFLSLHTAKNYRNNLLLKMDARNTADLVKKAMEWGLI